MCGLCGILGGQAHWTDSSANPDVFTGPAPAQTRSRERQGRTALVNHVLKHYGLSIQDWSGASYVLRGSTGKSAIVENLAQMWAQAELLTGKDFDPLDEALIDNLARR